MWRDICARQPRRAARRSCDALPRELARLRRDARAGRRRRRCERVVRATRATRARAWIGAGRRVTDRWREPPARTSISRPSRAPRARCALPGSKSISNRTLLLAALAEGATRDARPARLRRHARHARGAAHARRRLDAPARATAIACTGVRRAVPGASRRSSSSAMPARRSGRSPRCSRCPAATTGSRACRACTSGRSATWSMRCARLGARHRLSRQARAFRRSRSGRRGVALGAAVRVRGDVSSQFLTALLMALPLAGRRVAVRGRRAS